jgi:hypothetical protein
MKMNNMKMSRFLAGMLLGAALIAAGLLLSLLGYDALFIAAGGVAALIVAIVRFWQRGDQPEKDERTDKIRAFSLAYSWFASIILSLVIFCAVFMGIIDPSPSTALSAVIYIMTGSAILFIIVLNRRGDVGRS